MISTNHHNYNQIGQPAVLNEWSIVGTSCIRVKALADEIIKSLSKQFKCAYADVHPSHQNEITQLLNKQAIGAVAECSDNISYTQYNYFKSLDKIDRGRIFSQADCILLNGNHFEATAQIVIIDNLKKESLKRRVNQLTNVQLILFKDGGEVYDFLTEAIPSISTIPRFNLLDIEKIISFFRSKILEFSPKLNGLVLAGGKSVRLGQDKGSLNWHGKEQRYHIFEVLREYCQEVFISESETREPRQSLFPIITDTFKDLGPFGAILSAFRERPANAFVVLACDLPLFDKVTLDDLITHRNISSIATTFESPYDGLPEPLAAIWEPKSYPVLLQFLSREITCPRKVMLSNDITMIQVKNPNTLKNVNTPEEFAEVKNILKLKHIEK